MTAIADAFNAPTREARARSGRDWASSAAETRWRRLLSLLGGSAMVIASELRMKPRNSMERAGTKTDFGQFTRKPR